MIIYFFLFILRRQLAWNRLRVSTPLIPNSNPNVLKSNNPLYLQGMRLFWVEYLYSKLFYVTLSASIYLFFFGVSLGEHKTTWHPKLTATVLYCNTDSKRITANSVRTRVSQQTFWNSLFQRIYLFI